MDFADRALREHLIGGYDAALVLYKKAFSLERDAALIARADKLGEPTVSILYRSAATLALDAREVREAERLVASALAEDPPDDVADELRDLLEQVHFRRHLALRGIELNPSEFQFALLGPAVGFGMVASDEFVGRVHTIETLLYRTAERKLERPFREGGRRKQALQKEIDLYVSVPRAASFAVTFRIGSSAQLSLMPLGEDVVNEVLTCFELLNRGEDESLHRRITEPSYYRNFMALAAQIAPDGKDITGVGFTATRHSGAPREVELRRPKSSLPKPKVLAPAPVTFDRESPIAITGRLAFASNLEDQQNEIRVKTDQGAVYRVKVPEGLMNDIVRPLWNERVIVRGTRQSDDIVVLVTIDPAESEP